MKPLPTVDELVRILAAEYARASATAAADREAVERFAEFCSGYLAQQLPTSVTYQPRGFGVVLPDGRLGVFSRSQLGQRGVEQVGIPITQPTTNGAPMDNLPSMNI